MGVNSMYFFFERRRAPVHFAGLMRGYEHLRHAFAKQMRRGWWDCRVGGEQPVKNRAPRPQVARHTSTNPQTLSCVAAASAPGFEDFKPPSDWGTFATKFRVSVILLWRSTFFVFFVESRIFK